MLKTYVVSRSRRGDWYIGLYNNDKILQQVSTLPSAGSIIIRILNTLKKQVGNEVETPGKYEIEGEFKNREE